MTVISRTNLHTNPSLETSTTGYGTQGAHPPLAIKRTVALVASGTSTLASTPDNAALDIVGDIDIRAEFMLRTLSGTQCILSKGFAGTQQSYELLVGFTGGVPHLTLQWSTTGSDTLSVDHDMVEIAANKSIAVRVTMDVNDGAGNRVISFYTAPFIGGTWTLHGTATTTAGITSIFSGTSSLVLARDINNNFLVSSGSVGRSSLSSGGSSASLSTGGEIYAVEIRNGIAGTVVANPDFTAQAIGATSFTDGAGRVWTIAAGVITSTIFYPGAGHAALKVYWPGTVGLFDGVSTPSFTTTPGSAYMVSCWVFVPSGTPKVFISVPSLGLSAFNTAFDQWVRLAHAFTATGTSHTFSVLAADPPVTTAYGAAFYVDACLAEQANSVLPYFDGDTPGASWSGTTELSTSTLLAFDTAPSQPLTTIEFDATPPQATDFILDSSLLDGALVLVDTPRWINVAAQGDIINTCNIQRGKTDPNGDINVGFATINCDNWTGSFDPENLNSIYNRAPDNPYLVKGMKCRITALYDAGGVFTDEELFLGRLEDVALRKGLQPDATLHFVDDLAIFGTTAMISYQNSVRSRELTASRAAWLYTIGGFNSGVPFPSISEHLAREMVPTYGGGQVLDEYVDLVAAEAGRVFVDRHGVMQVKSHQEDYGFILATLSDNVDLTGIEYVDINASSGTMQITNACVVKRYSQDSNYPDVFAANDMSISRYGQIQVNGTTGYKAPLYQGGDVITLASYLANRRSTPFPRIDSVTVDFTGNLDAGLLLQAELGNQIVVSRTAPYIGNPQTLNLQLLIEGIQYAMDKDTFTQTLITAPTDNGSLFGGPGQFTLDTSLLDGPDVLTLF